MHLYLAQHGEAKPEIEDPERHLTAKGVADVRRVADFLRPLELKVSVVWHSGKARARETAEIFATAFSTEEGVVQRDDLSPKDPVEPVRTAIEQADDDLMIVGHLPFLGKLAGSLLTGNAKHEVLAFQYGGVVCLETDGGNQWHLVWMVVPELLRS